MGIAKAINAQRKEGNKNCINYANVGVKIILEMVI